VPGASNASSLQQKYNQGFEDGGCILGPPNCGAHGDAAGCGCTCHAGWSTIELQDPLNYRHCSVKETVKVGTEQRVDGSRELEEELKTGGDGGAEGSNWPLRSLQVEDWFLIFLAVLAIGLLMHRFYTNRQQSRARPPDAWKTTSLSYPHQDQVVIDEGAEDEDSVQAHMNRRSRTTSCTNRSRTRRTAPRSKTRGGTGSSSSGGRHLREPCGPKSTTQCETLRSWKSSPRTGGSGALPPQPPRAAEGSGRPGLREADTLRLDVLCFLKVNYC